MTLFFCKKVRARICWQEWKFRSERNGNIYTIKDCNIEKFKEDERQGVISLVEKKTR